MMIEKAGTVICKGDESILITGFVFDGSDYGEAKLDALHWAAAKILAAIEEGMQIRRKGEPG